MKLTVGRGNVAMTLSRLMRLAVIRINITFVCFLTFIKGQNFKVKRLVLLSLNFVRFVITHMGDAKTEGFMVLCGLIELNVVGNTLVLAA